MIRTNTKSAISKRIQAGDHQFFIGAYFYDADCRYDAAAAQMFVHRLRRRQQEAGCTPTSGWELIMIDNEWL